MLCEAARQHCEGPAPSSAPGEGADGPRAVAGGGARRSDAALVLRAPAYARLEGQLRCGRWAAVLKQRKVQLHTQSGRTRHAKRRRGDG